MQDAGCRGQNCILRRKDGYWDSVLEQHRQSHSCYIDFARSPSCKYKGCCCYSMMNCEVSHFFSCLEYYVFLQLTNLVDLHKQSHGFPSKSLLCWTKISICQYCFQNCSCLFLACLRIRTAHCRSFLQIRIGSRIFGIWCILYGLSFELDTGHRLQGTRRISSLRSSWPLHGTPHSFE